MSTYFGIPHPSASILEFKWASLGAKSTQKATTENGIQRA